MYLSRLEIFGFKSFAQKVLLRFDSGLTAIVGPNGCGKTNVVDAIRWALGEQRPTLLRSDRMEDVIFNGTKARKPLSIAEVSLTIENTKGILPSEYSEVVVTRRVYRSGESEYFLNRTLCRLKDIKDLFMDTGMGSDAYSVIELKMVETILSDRTEERRRLFEEAAGVTKYKVRRKETLRRLESVEQDLTRVNDIIREVQKAVNSLERQAHKAQRYNTLTERLRTLEIDLLTREYSGVVLNIKPLREQIVIINSDKQRTHYDLEKEEGVLDSLREEISELEHNSSGVLSTYTERQEKIHLLERNVVGSNERIKLLKSNIERYSSEQAALKIQRNEHLLKIEEFRIRLEQLRVNALEAENSYRQKKDELSTFETQVDAKQAILKEHQAQVITYLTGLSALRNQEGGLKAKQENNRGRLAFITEENDSYKLDIERATTDVERLAIEDKRLRQEYAEIQVRLHRAEEYKVMLQKDIELLRNREFELRTEIDRKEAKVEFLNNLIQSFEGFSEGARTLLTSKDWSTRIQTTVGETLQVEPEFRVGIETALGEAIGYIIVKNANDAFAAMRFLKQSQKGKTTFLCLDRLPNIQRDMSLPKIQGIIGWAIDLISCREIYRPMFEVLLDEVVVVTDVDAAIAVVSRMPQLRCVTTDGELITGKGILRGGSSRIDEGGHISKKQQIEEIEKDINQLKRQQQQIVEQFHKKSGELESLNVKALGQIEKKTEHQITSIEVRIAQVEFEKKRAIETIERNRHEYSRIENEITAIEKSLNELTPQIVQAERQIAEAERLVGATTSELQKMEAIWNDLSGKVESANITVMSLKSEIRTVEIEIEHNESIINSIDSTTEQRAKDILSSEKEIESLSEGVLNSEASLKTMRIEFESLTQEKQVIDKAIGEKRSEMHRIELRLKDERSKYDSIMESLKDLEIKLQELVSKSENLRERAKEGYDIELQLQLFPEGGFDFDTAHSEVRTLKERIKNLGPINHAAFEEFKSEKERLDFVIAQSKDLAESKKNLVSTIDEINTTAQQLFLTTFNQIRQNFALIFKSLFDEGDECDLRLEEVVDPLEAKIEITAKPRGKRPTSIDLLSGGEKTLTATALLFAIYLVKPSPFCILDEVDAPLDDANIDRFTRLLNKFSNNTQFIVVTHNKRTMESASAMYGVTMEEEGISKLVSVRFNEAFVQ